MDKNWMYKAVLDVKEIYPVYETWTKMYTKQYTEMKTKFEKYWEISYSNCILVIFDSRFQFGFVESRLNKIFGDIVSFHID